MAQKAVTVLFQGATLSWGPLWGTQRTAALPVGDSHAGIPMGAEGCGLTLGPWVTSKPCDLSLCILNLPSLSESTFLHRNLAQCWCARSIWKNTCAGTTQKRKETARFLNSVYWDNVLITCNYYKILWIFRTQRNLTVLNTNILNCYYHDYVIHK